MTAWSCRSVRLAAASLLAAGSIAGAGCVSTKYKFARVAADPPPAALAINASAPGASATLHAVIVFHGPGSWKQDAYWDEYVVTVSAASERPLLVEDAALVDQEGNITPAGHDPWETEATSRARLKVARHTGRVIMLGAGAGAAWLGSMALFASNLTICGGVANTTAATVGATGVVAIPIIALGSGVRTLVARHRITQEFHHRRIGLPAKIPAGGTHTGSFFFPVTPAPARLRLTTRDSAGTSHELALDLAPLARLHLEPAPAKPSAGP